MTEQNESHLDQLVYGVMAAAAVRLHAGERPGMTNLRDRSTVFEVIAEQWPSSARTRNGS